MRRFSYLALAALALAAPAHASTIVYESGGDILAVEPDGSDRRNLTRGVGDGDYFYPQLSDDGRVMTFMRKGRIYVADRRARHQRILRPPDPYVAGTTFADPILRHDAKQLMFRAVPLSKQSDRICRMRPTPDAVPRCGHGGHGRAYVSWGPKGTFLSTDQEDRQDICITSLDGDCTRPLIRIGEDWTFFQEPAVSPDGRYVAAATFARWDEKDDRIALFDARTGRHIRDLTRHENDIYPTFSPSGRHVAFKRGVPGNGPGAAICYVGIGGGKVRCPVRKITRFASSNPVSWGG